jgi:hypothetical protein
MMWCRDCRNAKLAGVNRRAAGLLEGHVTPPTGWFRATRLRGPIGGHFGLASYPVVTQNPNMAKFSCENNDNQPL